MQGMTHLDFEELFYLLPDFLEVIQNLSSELLHRHGVGLQHALECQNNVIYHCMYGGCDTAYHVFVGVSGVI